MDITQIFHDKQNAYLHLERYVNDGSPSGFTEKKTTSVETSPFRGAERFPLLEFADDDITSILLGTEQNLFNKGSNYAHPDSINSPILLNAGRRLTKTAFDVSPTAGGRTMLIRNWPSAGYIKLTYDVARLGRVDRQLSLKLCKSSLEVTNTIKRAVDAGK